MNIKYDGEYKSVSSFTWKDIPELAILTGLNGVGKSQLLELISRNLSTNPTDGDMVNLSPKWTITNIELDNKGVVYWNSKGSNFKFEKYKFHYSDFKHMIQAVYFNIHPDKIPSNHFSSADNSYEPPRVGSDPNSAFIRFWQILKEKMNKIMLSIAKSVQKPVGDLSMEDISYYFPEHILLENYDIVTDDSVEMIFYIFSYKKLLGEKIGKMPDELGAAPWDVFNEVLEASDIAYRVNCPNELEIESIFRYPLNEHSSSSFSVKLLNPIDGKFIEFDDLSSGERMLMSLAMLLYYSQKRGVNKKLLLMDEPDAHLHPSLTKKFFDVIYKILIKQYGIRVIMTTHSASTIALAPDGKECGIYEMKKNPTQIIKSKSKDETISLLSEGLVLVSSSIRYIIVEGVTDVDFYKAVHRKLLDSDKLNKDVSLAFVAGAGKNSVNHWSKGLREAGLSEIVKGVIDKDNGNDITDGIYRLDRYSIENYLLDPIVVAATLSTPPPALKSRGIHQGDEHKIIELSQHDLQGIADEILAQVSSLISRSFPLDAELEKVEFINGKILEYPKWLLNEKGKALLPKFQECFGGPGKISPQFLITAMKRTAMIPKSLEELFNKLQK
jgi:AAA15 family ATPase/GTPase